MNVAITVWNNRVSPVFDVARNLIILKVEAGSILQTANEMFANDQPEYKAGRLFELQVNTLICGAISRYYARVISTHRIKLIPFITGDIDDVSQAFLLNKLPNPRLVMPGCCKSRRSMRGKQK